MVGIGGRTKACGPCRRRRVKCDETRPACRRCTKAKLECTGYPATTFIHYYGCRDHAVTTRASQDDCPDAIMKHDRPKSKMPLKLTHLDTAFVLNLPQDDRFVAYTLSRLLQGPEKEERHLLEHGIDRTLSDECFLALSTAYFGVEHCEKAIAEHGFHRYGGALKALNAALGTPSQRETYDVLEAVIIMALFEFLISDQQNGWIEHSVGLERLFQLRGPENCTSFPELTAMQKSRLTIIFASLVLRKHTIFSERKWKTIPWTHFPERKDQMQTLTDILADCPDLYVLKDSIFSNSSKDARVMQSEVLLLRIRAGLNQLESWWTVWSATQSDYYIETPVTESVPIAFTPDGKAMHSWSSNLIFRSLFHANALALYDATNILFLKLEYETVQVYGPNEEAKETFRQSMYPFGIRICQGVQYHLDCLRRGAGSFFLLFPLRMAWEAVGQFDTAIGNWLKDILHTISTGAAGRWAIAGYILNIKPPVKKAHTTSVTEVD